MAGRQHTHFRREAASQPGSPGPAAQNDISPVLARGARTKNAGGASGGGCLGAGVSPFFGFLFPPLSLNSLARCPSGTSCARLPTHRSRHCAEMLPLGVWLCANECARMWGPVRRRRGCPREVEGCWIWLVPLGLQVESEDLWLAVDLSPSPGSLLLPLPASDYTC